MPGRYARHAGMGPVASGHVDCKRELLRRAELGDQALKRLAQVRDGSFAAVALTVRTHTGAQLRVSTPDTVFVLFHGVWDVHGPGHGPRLLQFSPLHRSLARPPGA